MAERRQGHPGVIVASGAGRVWIDGSDVRPKKNASLVPGPLFRPVAGGSGIVAYAAFAISESGMGGSVTPPAGILNKLTCGRARSDQGIRRSRGTCRHPAHAEG